jgi:hypothetical protein
MITLTMADDEDEKKSFHIGDRVILHNLRNFARLNGRHGVVASSCDETTQRYGVDLDLPDPKHPKALVVKAVNLLPEPKIPTDAAETRAGTQNGLLVEEHGRDVSFVLDTVRFLVGFCLLKDPDIQYLPDIDRLKDLDMIKVNYLTALGWTHWLDPGAFSGTGGRGIYQCLKEYLRNDMVKESWGSVDNMPPDYRRIYDALVHPAAVMGWNVRVHGDFWIVSMDSDGTYIVPDLNHRAVYQVLGLTQPLGTMVHRQYNGRIVKMRLTMIPWFGRLVYDGVVSPVDSFGDLAGPEKAGARLEQKLREAVKSAKKDGRVVARLAQLEVTGGSRVGIDGKEPTSGTDTLSLSTPPQEQPEASAEEQRLVKDLKAIPHIPPSMRSGTWTFRRFAYTEEENPEHIGIILQAKNNGAPSRPIAQFSCSVLQPTSVTTTTVIFEATAPLPQRIW